jgi:hypothetical protein
MKAKLCLEGGIVLGSQLDKFKLVGAPRSKARDEERKNRGVLPGDDTPIQASQGLHWLQRPSGGVSFVDSQTPIPSSFTTDSGLRSRRQRQARSEQWMAS